MSFYDRMVLSTFQDYIGVFVKPDTPTLPALSTDKQAQAFITGIDALFYNSVFLREPELNDHLIEELRSVQQSLGKTLTVWVNFETQEAQACQTLLQSHFVSPGDFYGMVLPLEEASVQPAAEHVTVEQVLMEAQITQFNEIVLTIFEMQHLRSHFEDMLSTQAGLSDPGAINYLALFNDQPVGGASLVLDHSFTEAKVGGFYNAAVLPDFRQKGVAMSMACERIKKAKALGLSHLSIILMADAMARGYCEFLGFQNAKTLTPYFIS